MSTIKQDRKDLEMLLNGISPIENTPAQPTTNTSAPQPAQPATTSVIDNAGSDMGIEKVFDFDADSLRKGLRKRARKSVLNIVKHVLTDQMAEEEYVQDKIEQDIETLTDLYMQVETNNLMQKALVTTVSRGNLMPRYFEVFGQLTDKISNINKQIVDTEQKLRKTYVDLKYEIRDKEEEVAALAGMQSPALATSQPSINGVMVTSSKELNERAKQKHREALEKAKEISYIEENG